MNNWEKLIESVIDAVHFNQITNEVKIEVTTPWENKEKKQIIATGVDDFVINDMRLSNIIDRINVVSQSDIESKKIEVARRLFFLLRGIEPSKSDLEWSVLHDKLQLIQYGHLIFLEIEPVYGATILILAKHVELQSIK